jgi:hypothetical protein
MRTGGAISFGAEAFDNRAKTFPQDSPSAGFLKKQGIACVLLAQKIAKQPEEDWRTCCCVGRKRELKSMPRASLKSARAN